MTMTSTQYCRKASTYIRLLQALPEGTYVPVIINHIYKTPPEGWPEGPTYIQSSTPKILRHYTSNSVLAQAYQHENLERGYDHNPEP